MIKQLMQEKNESEEELKILGVTYEDILNNKHELIGEESDNANWEAGKISVIKKIIATLKEANYSEELKKQ